MAEGVSHMPAHKLPTALAPSADLATPRVYRYALKIVDCLAPAELIKFFLCSPSTSTVIDHHGNQWVEATWGADIETEQFSMRDLAALFERPNAVQIEAITVTAKDSLVILEVTLCGRVLRH
jgi:hypothetical protein